ncbi:MAG TPA: FAD-binding oxidoreductase, partial [Ktedonobacter sp.]|nr:FAD-binding oxidoreductase [Ktedonobacter sp.]
ELARTVMAAFEHTDGAGEAVSGIIAAGIVPAAVEMMDKLAISACEASAHAGFPLDAGAVL